MKKLITLIVLLYMISSLSYSQEDNQRFNFGKYTIEANYDTANYCSDLIVYRGSLLIHRDTCVMKVTSINAYDLDDNGKKEIVIEYYSGGAHCCTSMNIYSLENDKFTVLDSMEWGNSFFDVKDLDGDGSYEIEGVNDMFAYAFTNFAQSCFPAAIYKFKNGKLYLANKEFKEKVLKDIKEYKDQLKKYTKTGFECPSTADEETFNTDAGAVKAILAAIVGDYYTIGMTDEGYGLINKVYKCPDKDKFIKILKNDYKLK